MRLAFLFAAISTFLCFAEIRQHPGGKQLPHERYIHVVSEQDSPVEQVYIKTKDGIYVAAAMRKPKGPGPFPVLIHFHGAPGGRGMEKLVQWVRGDTGGPVWERFLQEGFVVVVADYRRIEGRRMAEPLSPDAVTYIDDGMAVVDYVRGLKYVDPNRITVLRSELGRQPGGAPDWPHKSAFRHPWRSGGDQLSRREHAARLAGG